MGQVDVTATFEVEQPDGSLAPLKLADLHVSDPAAGPGALDATVAQVKASVDAAKASVDAVRALLAAPLDVQPRPAHVTVDNPTDVSALALDATVAAMSGKLPAKNGDGGALAHVTNWPGSQHVTVDNPDDLSALARDATVAAVRDRLPAATAGDGGLQVHVLNETPATDVSALSTAAKQDAQTALLTSLAGTDFATGSEMATLATKLDAIATNTAAIKLDADHLSITADSINLETAGVETRLDTLNGRDFATQATLAQLKARGDLLAADATVAAIGAQLPVALVGGRLDVNVGAGAINVANWPGSQTVHVDNFPGTQPISAAALPLPAGAAQEHATAASWHSVRLTDGAAYLSTTAGRLQVADGGVALKVDGSAATQPVSQANPADQASTLVDGRKTAVTPGTALAIRASLACKWVTVSALDTNTKVVYVGGSDVLATAGSQAGVPLFAGGSVTIPVANASAVFVDAQVAGEGVAFVVGS